MYDLLIKNGKVINGTGSPSFFADVAILDGKIARIGKGIEGAEKVIDAKGLTITPGFIDSHSHSDNALLTYPDLVEKIEQGITTSIGGQCGESPIPMDEFLDSVRDRSFGSNTALLVGHSMLRRTVMGMENREPTVPELQEMKRLLCNGMNHGALGISFGLIYAPSVYAKTEELIELAKLVGEYHGIVAAHIRGEGNCLIKAVDEFITIIRESGARGVLSHHKVAGGKENWGKVNHSLRMIEKANSEGVEIYCDVYPYVATHTSLDETVIPPERHSNGSEGLLKLLSQKEERQKLKEWGRNKWGEDLSWIQISKCNAYPEYVGMRVSDIAALRGTDPYDAMYDMMADSNFNCNACYFTMCEEDVETVLAYPRAMICTDSSVAKGANTFHPRLKGSFPRVLGRYVRERKVTTLPEMIRKMTSMPASVYGLQTKGLIWEGMDADICIFDAEKIRDRSEFTDCNHRAEGLNYVILGGKVVVENAVYNGKKMGKVLTK